MRPMVDTYAMWVEDNKSYLPSMRAKLQKLVESYAALESEPKTCSPRFTKFVNSILDPRITELDAKVKLIAEYLRKAV